MMPCDAVQRYLGTCWKVGLRLTALWASKGRVSAVMARLLAAGVRAKETFGKQNRSAVSGPPPPQYRAKRKQGVRDDFKTVPARYPVTRYLARKERMAG